MTGKGRPAVLFMARRKTNSDVEVDLAVPILGLDETRAYTRQRSGTTPMAQNVRSFEPETDRARMGQRPGLEKMVNSRMVGAYPIQEMAMLATNNVSNPTLTVGENLYSGGSGGGFGAADLSGSALWTGGAVAGFALACSCWDDSGYVYIAEVNTTTGGVNIYKYSAAGALQWLSSAPFTVTTGSLRAVCGMTVISGVLFVACTQGGVSRIHGVLAATGALAYPNYATSTVYSTMVFSTAAVNCLGRIGTLMGIECRGTANLQNFRIINILGGTTTTAYGGTGADNRSVVRSDGVSFFYVIASTSVGCIKKITTGGVIQWTSTAADTPSGLAYDFLNGQLIAVKPSTPSCRSLSLSAGTLLTSGDPGAITTWNWIDGASDGTYTLWRDATAGNDTMGTDTTFSTVWGPTTRANVTHSGCSVNKGQTLQAGLGGSRQIRLLAVSNGTCVRFTTSGAQLISGGSVFATHTPAVYSVQSGLDMYFVDGTVYYYYRSSTNSMVAWTSTAGTMPVDSRTGRARLIANWNNRIVLAGFPNDPQNWYMSAKNAPRNWDSAPAVTVVSQAVNGTNPIAGSPGNLQDIINCIIRYSDDTLLFGCDHSIIMMAGDPMEGGSLQVVSPIGVAFGRPFCIDENYQIYFYSTNGGVYKFTPGAKPVPISQPIKRRLEGIDLSSNVITMAYDTKWQGFGIWVTPYDSTKDGTNFFYEVRTNAWFPDFFENKNHCPQSVLEYDGDLANDRTILLGCRDGYIRKMTTDATDDDGTAIDSFVLIGPIKTPNLDSILFKDPLAILGSESADVRYDVYSGRSPEEAFLKASAPSAVNGIWKAGRNTVSAVRRDGHAHYVKLSASAPWTVEKITAWYQTQGMVLKRG